MIKKIIFDIDKTLLDSTIDCIKAYNNYLKENKDFSNKLDAQNIYDVLEKFEKSNILYTKENLSNFIKDCIGKNFSVEDLEKMFDYYGKEATLISNETDKVLKYLSEKYEIIALSNWFYEVQESRLEKAGIKKYFKKVYGVDNLGRKPDINVFKKACEPFLLKECVIVGDNLENDIKVSSKIGMRSIYLNRKKVYTKFENIENIEELLNIL